MATEKTKRKYKPRKRANSDKNWSPEETNAMITTIQQGLLKGRKKSVMFKKIASTLKRTPGAVAFKYNTTAPKTIASIPVQGSVNVVSRMSTFSQNGMGMVRRIEREEANGIMNDMRIDSFARTAEVGTGLFIPKEAWKEPTDPFEFFQKAYPSQEWSLHATGEGFQMIRER